MRSDQKAMEHAQALCTEIENRRVSELLKIYGQQKAAEEREEELKRRRERAMGMVKPNG